MHIYMYICIHIYIYIHIYIVFRPKDSHNLTTDGRERKEDTKDISLSHTHTHTHTHTQQPDPTRYNEHQYARHDSRAASHASPFLLSTCPSQTVRNLVHLPFFGCLLHPPFYNRETWRCFPVGNRISLLETAKFTKRGQKKKYRQVEGDIHGRRYTCKYAYMTPLGQIYVFTCNVCMYSIAASVYCSTKSRFSHTNRIR